MGLSRSSGERGGDLIFFSGYPVTVSSVYLLAFGIWHLVKVFQVFRIVSLFTRPMSVWIILTKSDLFILITYNINHNIKS